MPRIDAFRRPTRLQLIFRWALFVAFELTFTLGVAILVLLVAGVMGMAPLVRVAGGIITLLATTYLVLWLEGDDYKLSRLFGLQTQPNTSPVKEHFFRHFVPGGSRYLKGTEGAESSKMKEGRLSSQTATREIVETVVFVVVLVLLLKSFAAEAFVIPTGSMAETLYGYQKQVKCTACNFEFPVNCSQESDPPSDGKPVPVMTCTCPNCRQTLVIFRPVPPASAFEWAYQSIFGADQWIDPRTGATRATPDKSKNEVKGYVNSGDRVLVAKFLYDLLRRQPDRLDVVVFKYPEGPQKNWTPMNYIKRLIGEPGETIGIWYGKLYVLPPDLLPEDKAIGRRFLLGQLFPPDLLSENKALEYEQERQAVKPEDLWQKRYMHENDLVERLKQSDGGFRMIQKPPAKILSMMRIVYDHDHPAEDLKGVLPPRWATEETWTTDGPTAFRADAGDGLAWLRYQHILRPPPGLPERDHRPELITDFMGYNSYEPRRGDGLLVQPPNWVGDLVLECEVTVDRPDGELVLELSKGADRFRARFDLASGKCTLYRLDKAHTGRATPGEADYTEIDSRPTDLKGKGTRRVRFANVDNRLIVWVGNSLPFGDGVSYTPVAEHGPYPNDLQPASIGVKGASVRIGKLKLFRDTYYTVKLPPEAPDASLPFKLPWMGDSEQEQVEKLTELHKFLSDSDQWKRMRDLPAKTLYVQPGHYLCLGDNSPESSDGRSWGLVPRRLLLGRALMIYWPAGRIGSIK